MATKLAIPNVRLLASDEGETVQTKFNNAMQAVDDNVTAYNAQVDASDTAAASAASAKTEADRASTIVLTPLLQIRKSKLDNPLTHILKKNKLVDTLSGALTWARATTATYVDRYGVVKTAAINEPREEADGWLIEGASTNLCLQSEDFSNAAWSKISGVTITPNSITAPDGNLTASTIDFASTGDIFCVQHINYTIGSINIITASLYVKAGTASGIQFRTILFGTQMQDISSVFDAITGAWVTVGIGHTVTVKKLSGGWYRISATTIDNGTGSPSIELRVQGNNLTGNYYIWGAQVEALPFATSYIPTTTAAVTRAADNVSFIFDKNHPDLVNNLSDITYSLSFSVLGINPVSMAVFGQTDGFQHSLMRVNANFNFYNFYREANSKQTGVNLGINVKNSAVITIKKDNTLNLYTNGVLNSSTIDVPSVAIANPTSFEIGSWSGYIDHLYGHLQDFRIYDFALNADEVSFLSGE